MGEGGVEFGLIVEVWLLGDEGGGWMSLDLGVAASKVGAGESAIGAEGASEAPVSQVRLSHVRSKAWNGFQIHDLGFERLRTELGFD